jgi:hypothetical protein
VTIINRIINSWVEYAKDKKRLALLFGVFLFFPVPVYLIWGFMIVPPSITLMTLIKSFFSLVVALIAGNVTRYSDLSPLAYSFYFFSGLILNLTLIFIEVYISRGITFLIYKPLEKYIKNEKTRWGVIILILLALVYVAFCLKIYCGGGPGGNFDCKNIIGFLSP